MSTKVAKIFLMLPCFKQIERELDEFLQAHLKERVLYYSPLLNQVKYTVQHEGDKSEYEDVKRNKRKCDFKKFETKLEIDSIKNESYKDIIDKIELAAKSTAGHFDGTIFSKVSEVCEETGNVHDNQGRPLSPNDFLESIEKIEIYFDDNGKPLMPNMYVGEKMAEYLKKKIPEWEKDEAMKAEFEKLIEKKHEEFLEKEAKRRIID